MRERSLLLCGILLVAAVLIAKADEGEGAHDHRDQHEPAVAIKQENEENEGFRDWAEEGLPPPIHPNHHITRDHGVEDEPVAVPVIEENGEEGGFRDWEEEGVPAPVHHRDHNSHDGKPGSDVHKDPEESKEEQPPHGLEGEHAFQAGNGDPGVAEETRSRDAALTEELRGGQSPQLEGLKVTDRTPHGFEEAVPQEAPSHELVDAQSADADADFHADSLPPEADPPHPHDEVVEEPDESEPATGDEAKSGTHIQDHSVEHAGEGRLLDVREAAPAEERRRKEAAGNFAREGVPPAEEAVDQIPTEPSTGQAEEEDEIEDDEEEGNSEPQSKEFLCRICGNPIFFGAFHLHDYRPDGPLVAGFVEEPELGSKGKLLKVFTTAAASHGHDDGANNPLITQQLALFDTANGITFTDHTKAPLSNAPFAFGVSKGHSSEPVMCSKCGQLIGWYYRARSGTDQAAANPPAGAVPTASPTEQVRVTAPQPAATAAPVVIPYLMNEEMNVLAPLAGKCLELHTGWWSYKMCYRGEIFQFHRESDGSNNPIWSLGKFDSQGKVERARPISQESGYYTSHFFVGGQHCDETNKGRSTEVQYFCCPNPSKTKEPSFGTVEEPALCKYRVRVCVPWLCSASPSASAPVADAASNAQQAFVRNPTEAPTQPAEERPQGIQGHGQGEGAISFFAAIWNNIIGESSPSVVELVSGGPVSGISPVRFSGGK